MESVSDIIHEKPAVEDKTTHYNKSAAEMHPSTPGSLNGSVLNFVEGTKHENIPLSRTLSSQNCTSEILTVFKNGEAEHMEDNGKSVAAANEDNVVEKVVSTTIFENAVQVVKNLFSPAKAHGIFSRNTTQVMKTESDIKTVPVKNNMLQSEGLPPKLEQHTTSENKTNGILMNLENSIYLADDVNNSTLRNYSNPIAVHDNTNDSYTTTVSRMDESFQSTITHFDENLPSDAEKSNNSIEKNCLVLDVSLNETMNTNENSLNNTLKKDLSLCSTVNGDLNNTFELPINKVEINEMGKGVESNICIKNLSNDCVQEAKTFFDADEFIAPTSASKEAMKSIDDEEIPSSTPNKNIKYSDNVSVEFVSKESTKNVHDLNSQTCAIQDCDKSGLNQFLHTNKCLETDCLIFSIESENMVTGKLSPSQSSSGIEKNFSTSTITISKTELNGSNHTIAKDEGCRDVERDESKAIDCPEVAVEGNKSSELNSSTYSSSISSDNKDPSAYEKGLGTEESNLGHSLKITVQSELNSVNDGNHYTKCEIPLASQKSYTLLHSPNANLNRPVVENFISDVQTDKLNDLMLGGYKLSDTNVISNYSEELLCGKSDINPNLSNNMSWTSCGLAMRPGNLDEVNAAVLNGDASDKISEFSLKKKQDLDFNDSISTTSCGNRTMILESEFDATKSAEKTNLVNTPTENMLIPSASEEKLPKSEVINALNGASAASFNNSSKSNALGNTEQGMLLVAANIGGEVQTNSHEKEDFSYFCGDGKSTGSNPLCLTASHTKKEREESENSAETRVFETTGTPNSSTKTLTSQAMLESVIMDFQRLKMNDSIKDCEKENFGNEASCRAIDSLTLHDEGVFSENYDSGVREPILGNDTDLTQFIQEQFSAVDIEKICSVVDDIPKLNLSKSIVLASQHFDKSFHEKSIIEDEKKGSFFGNNNNALSSASLDFLYSIKGKSTGRDYSRESLYIKFDPLVQTKHSNELLDISDGDKENLVLSSGPKNCISDPLVPVTPLKQTTNISTPLSPLAPSSQKNESKLSAEKSNRLREMQNEITRLKEYYLQREEANKEKFNNYENEIAKLTGKACVLEKKLKESEEMEKSLVKKLNDQNESTNRLKNIVEEYLVYIGKLTDQIESVRMERQKQIGVLTEERDFYMNHLQSTEQAFSDVHSKYEKCKKAVEIFKGNEETYKTEIEDLKERVEQYSEKVKEIQESASRELERLQDKMNDMKFNHTQEISRYKAQLRKTELKVQTMQDALDQKVKENQELARICDELIDGKKCNR